MPRDVIDNRLETTAPGAPLAPAAKAVIVKQAFHRAARWQQHIVSRVRPDSPSEIVGDRTSIDAAACKKIDDVLCSFKVERDTTLRRRRDGIIVAFVPRAPVDPAPPAGRSPLLDDDHKDDHHEPRQNPVSEYHLGRVDADAAEILARRLRVRQDDIRRNRMGLER